MYSILYSILQFDSFEYPLLMKSNVNSSSSFPGLRVLVVDDDADSCYLLKLALELHEIETHTVSSARLALKAFVRLQPDVLISDIAMPNEDGYWLMRKIRELDVQQHDPTPTIAVTAVAIKPHEALSRGFYRFLPKPVEIAELVNEIADLVVQREILV